MDEDPLVVGQVEVEIVQQNRLNFVQGDFDDLNHSSYLWGFEIGGCGFRFQPWTIFGAGKLVECRIRIIKFCA